MQKVKKPSADVNHDPFSAIRGGESQGNRFLESIVDDDDARFARIYGAGFEGQYFDLPGPMLFLVHGDGQDAGTVLPDGDGRTSGDDAQDSALADDLKVWAYDKSDFSIRLDVDTGPFETVLLEVIFGADGFGGAGVSGANVRGANVRGANVRGANVRGANVRGANVRGANVRGANVRGANVRGDSGD